MNNLTTRKIVLGMLMTLVLAFGVQGTADAITRFTSSSGDLQLHPPKTSFTVRFSVGLQSAAIKPGHKRIPLTDINKNPVTINPTTPYYDDSDGTGFLGTGVLRDSPLSYDAAHNYNEESINITVEGATLKKVGNFNATGASHTMSEGGVNAARLTSSVPNLDDCRKRNRNSHNHYTGYNGYGGSSDRCSCCIQFRYDGLHSSSV